MKMYKYKQSACLNGNCILKVNGGLQPLSGYFNCKNHHGAVDRCRDPRTYKALFMYESKDEENPYCNNVFEYLYHPEVY